MVPKPIIIIACKQPPTTYIPQFNTASVRTKEKPQTSQPKTLRTTPTKTLLALLTTTTQKLKNTNKTLQTSSISALILNTLDDIINTFIDPPIKPSVDPRHVLSQNFAPVLDELPPTQCKVIKGTLPPSLNGVYIRNGPNPQFLPRGPYHLFDGDGMLHAVKITNGKATLCSRYVQTYKYKIENEAGYQILPNVFSGFNSLIGLAARGSVAVARVLTGQYNPINGIGLINTSLALFGNRLFALGESDLPYEIKVTPNGDIQTIGRYDFNGKLFMNMTAHPKIDSDTGECFAYRYGLIRPFLTYFRFDSNGVKHNDVPVFSMKRPSFLHDFAITKKYALFADIQLEINPLDMIFGGSPVRSDPSKVPRIGILPRYADNESKMKWFDVPGLNIMHLINAWDEEDGKTVTIVAPNILCVEHMMERLELIHEMIEKVRINVETGIVTRQPLSARNLDLAVINNEFLGKKHRFIYAAIGNPMPKFSGVVKIDVLKGEEVGCRLYGEDCYGGEPFFVAREDGEEEDDGYLVSYVHDEKKGESRFLVMDAKSPEFEIVAEVKLPRRVPYGFHGLFVKESDITRLSVS
ncbi:putative oxidoreductase [Medicago truncatula]|uniref:Carotenoid cleavage dioxygenase 4a-6 n=1 Tax=Medicago truncatula TaxID=3880 RepID=G7K2Q5_MEDTR|nr:probable carotenoid cleavage dioxygenase 4, chloroplastic [Medicago truncatula]AES95418.1 carotenoid cleavage dioxygenase 4a-6 [Medicago truncatula]RHN54528.1 putative oxidoreductase [Medicago truncatula]